MKASVIYRRPSWTKRKLAFRDDRASVFGPVAGQALYHGRRWWNGQTPEGRIMALGLWALCGSLAFGAAFLAVLVAGILM